MNYVPQTVYHRYRDNTRRNKTITHKSSIRNKTKNYQKEYDNRVYRLLDTVVLRLVHLEYQRNTINEETR